jgi:hypothetical protein
MKFFALQYILQQPIETLQILSRDFFKFAKLMRKIPNELESQKRNASRSLPVILECMPQAIAYRREDGCETH